LKKKKIQSICSKIFENWDNFLKKLKKNMKIKPPLKIFTNKIFKKLINSILNLKNLIKTSKKWQKDQSKTQETNFPKKKF